MNHHSFLLFIISALFHHLLARESLYFIIILPLNGSNSTIVDRWERGQELLAGAERAMESINNSGIIHGYELEMLVIDSGACNQPHHNFEAGILPSFVNYTVHQEYNIISAIGMFCPQSTKLISGLVNRYKERTNFPVISGSQSPDVYNVELHPNLLHIFSSSISIIKAVVRLMEYQQWRRVGIITDLEDTFYSQTANHFTNFIRMYTTLSIVSYTQVQSFSKLPKSFNTRVVFVSTDLSTAIQIICDAFHRGFKWPSYAWIFHTHSVGDLMMAHDALCSSRCLDSIFILQNEYETSHAHARSEICNCNNPYANALYESMWISALIMNATTHTSLNRTGHSSLMNDSMFNQTQALFGSTRVDISQILSGEPTIIAHYHPSTEDLIVYNQQIRDNDIPPEVKYRPVLAPLLIVYYVLTAACTVLVTVDIVLFIYLRKEPEIKATSFSITIFMFLSCYMFILYLSLLTLEEHLTVPSKYHNVICFARSWLNVLSIPGSLLIVTILIKMLRIYRIFLTTNFNRAGRFFSNIAVVCYILLLQIPNIIIMLLWSVVDPYHNIIKRARHTNFDLIQNECSSEHLKVWPFLLLGYNFVLSIVLIVVAIKTRKIRKMNFKDTKKVNAFIYLFLFMTVLIIGLWLIARNADMTTYGQIGLFLGHVCMIVIVQGLLFIPKLYPPTKRWILCMDQKKRKQSQVSLNSIISSKLSNATRITSLSKQSVKSIDNLPAI